MPCLQDIVSEINGCLDAEALLRRMGYHPEKIMRAEASGKATIKGFCPIHREKAFRSLLVYEDQRRFTCTFLKCPGRNGGSLVDLYAMAKDLNPMAAALELVREMDLPVDLSQFADLGKDLAEQAIAAMNAQQWEEALKSIEEACAIATEDSGYHRLRAQVLRQMEREDEALEAEMLVAELFRRQGALDEAVDLLEGLHAAYPDLMDVAAKMAEVLDEAGRQEERQALLKSLCERLLSAGGEIHHFQPFEDYLAACPDDGDMRGRLAALYEAASEPSKAAEHWDVLVRGHIAAGQGEAALEALAELERLQGAIRGTRALKVAALRLTGECDRAGEELAGLADEARQEGRLDEARDFLEQAVAGDAQNQALLVQLAEIAEQQNDAAGAGEYLLRASRILLEAGDYPAAAAMLRKTAVLAPDLDGLPEAREKLFKKWMGDKSSGKTAGELANLAFDMDAPDVGLSICRGILSRKGSAPTERIAALAAMQENALGKEAAEEAGACIESMLKKQPEGAAAVARWAYEQWPADLKFLAWQAQSLKSAGQADEAAEAFAELADARHEEGQAAEAFEDFAAALELAPGRVDWLEKVMATAREASRLGEAAPLLGACADHLIQQEQHEQALVPLRHMLHLDEDNLEALERLAQAYEASGNATEASARFAQLARKHGLKGEIDVARAAWERCLALQGDQLGCSEEYAHFLGEHGSVDEALAAYQRLIALLHAHGHKNRTAKAFKEALALVPDDEGLLDQRLDWLLQTGQRDAAVKELERLREELAGGGKAERRVAILRRLAPLRPDDHELSYELAEALEAAGDAEQAVRQYRKTADLCRGRKAPEAACQALERLLELAPHDEPARSALADILLAEKKTDAAAGQLLVLAAQCRECEDTEAEAEWLERLLDIGVEQLESLERLARIRADQGDRKQAAIRFEALLSHYAEAKEWEKTVDAADELRRIDPKNPVACRHLARALEALERTDEARAVLGDWAQIACEIGDIDTAIDCWRQLQSMDNENPEWFEGLGKLFESVSNHDAAFAEFDAAAERYDRTGKPAAAARLWSKMLEMRPEQTRLRHRLAEHRLNAGETAEAVQELMALAELAANKEQEEDLAACLSRLSSLAEGEPRIALDLVDLLLRLGRTPLAIEQALKAAEALLKAAEPESAGQLIERALEHEPEHLDLRELNVRVLLAKDNDPAACAELLSLGSLLLKKKEYKRAEEAFFRVVLIDPHCCEARESLVECFLQTKRSGKAFVELKTLGRTHLHLNQPREAVDALRRALELRGDHLETRALLVETLLQLEQIDEAKAELAKAIELEADDPDTLKKALEAYLALKPQDLDVVRWKADLVAATQSLDEALADYRQLASMLEYQSPKEARRLYEQLIERYAQSADLGKEFARFLGRTGDSKACEAQWLKVLDAALGGGLVEEAVECAEEAARQEIDSQDLRIRLLEAFSAAGQNEAAAEQALMAAGDYFVSGDSVHGEEMARRGAALNPAQADVQTRAITMLYENSLGQAALEVALEAARCLIAASQEEEGLALCRMAEDLLGADSALLGLKVEALEKSGRPAEVSEACQAWAEALRAAGSLDEAETAARRGVELQDRAESRRLLADLLMEKGASAEAAEELFHFASFWRKGKNAGEAIEALQKAVELDPSHCRAQQELAHLYSLTGEPDKAREVRLIVGKLQTEAGDDQAAIDTYAAILRTHPQDISVYRKMIEAAVRAGDDQRCMDGLHALADYLAKINAVSESIAVYRQALDRSPEDDKSLRALPKLYRKLGDVVAAAEMIERRAEIFAEKNDNAKALKLYREALRLEPVDVDALGRIARRMLALGERDEALEHLRAHARQLSECDRLEDSITALQEVLQDFPRDQKTRSLLADVLQKAGRNQDAAEVLIGLANDAQLEDRLSEALELRSRVRVLAPDDTQNLRALSVLHQGQDDTEVVFQILSDLTQAHRKKGEFDSAIDCCRKMIEAGGDETQSRRQMAQLFEETGALEQALEEYGATIAGCMEAGRLDEAETDLHHVLELQPENEAFRDQFVNLMEKQGRIDQAALFLIEDAETAAVRRDQQRLRKSLDRLSRTQGLDANARLKIISLSDEAKLDDVGNQQRLELARNYLEEGRIREARTLCDEAIGRCEDPREIRVHVAEMYNEYCIPELAVEEYLELTRLCLEQDALEEAVGFAQEGLLIQSYNIALRELAIEAYLALERFDEAYSHCFELAETAYENGTLAQAELTLRRMINMREEDMAPRRRLAAILREAGKVDELKAVLHDLAKMLAGQGEKDEACKRYREVLELDAEDIGARKSLIDLAIELGRESEVAEDYLALADQYARDGAVLDATRAFERLLGIDPRNIGARKRFIQFLSSQGQHTRLISETMDLARVLCEAGNEHAACRAYEMALEVAPQEQNLLESLASTYAHLRLNGKAVQTYRRLLAIQGTENNATGEAQTLEKILALDAMDFPARSQLIDLLTSCGRHDEAAGHAMKLAEQHLERGLPDLAEQIYRELLSHDPNRIEVWQRLIETHLKIGAEGDLIPDYVILADLLGRQGQLSEACNTLRRAIQIAPDQVEFRRKYISIYLQVGDESGLVQEYTELGDCLARKEEFQRAVECYDVALKHAPKSRDIQQKREHALAQMRDSNTPGEDESEARQCLRDHEVPALSDTQAADLEKMVRIWRSQLKMNGAIPSIHGQIAEALERLGQFDRAWGEWDAASALYLEQGEIKRCIEVCQHVLRRNPDDKKMLRRLSQAEAQDDSMRILDTALQEMRGGGKTSASALES